MSTNWKDTSYDLILVIVGLHDEPMRISRCTRAAGDNFRHCNSMPRSPKVSNQDSVFALKLWPSSSCCCLGVKQTMIQSSLSSTNFRRCYATSRRRYRLMYPGFPTRSLATETQSSPPSSGSSGTTFELNRIYHPNVFYEDIKWESHD